MALVSKLASLLKAMCVVSLPSLSFFSATCTCTNIAMHCPGTPCAAVSHRPCMPSMYTMWVSGSVMFSYLRDCYRIFWASELVAMLPSVLFPCLLSHFSPRHEHEHCPGTPCAAAAVVSHRQECVQFKGGNGEALGVTMKLNIARIANAVTITLYSRVTM